MYRDIIEVTPERNYHLFVRFKDGLAGRVRLQESEMTGALAPLRDVEFFERVYIDHGTLTWPGGIDLAPDVPGSFLSYSDFFSPPGRHLKSRGYCSGSNKPGLVSFGSSTQKDGRLLITRLENSISRLSPLGGRSTDLTDLEGRRL